MFALFAAVVPKKLELASGGVDDQGVTEGIYSGVRAGNAQDALIGLQALHPVCAGSQCSLIM